MKKVLIIGTIAGISLAAWTLYKWNQIEETIPGIKSGIDEIKTLEVKNGILKSVLDIFIKNTTSENLSIHGIVAKISRVIFLDKASGKQIAHAIVDINQIHVPANGYLIIKDVELRAPFVDTLLYLLANSQNLSNKIAVKVEIKALGKTFLV